ncbi:MAG: ribosome maturation factor RimP [Bacteroidetes bacterium]|nr:ribosome maturation factor RimP [Bacteroidota bacterium]
MDLKEKIKDLAEKSLGSPAHFLVDVVVSKHKPMKITVIVDGDQGITIDDCAAVSRALNDSTETLIDEQYSLEVSTPGLDHPLKMKRQYVKNKGRGLKAVLKNKSIVTGVLKEVVEEKIVVETESGKGKKIELKTVEIPFSEIEKAFVTVSFK